MAEIKIIKEITEEKPYLVIYKPAGLPSAPLTQEDLKLQNNAFSMAAALFPQLLTVQGKKSIEHGLIHRIDTVTAGILVIAATQECYDNLLMLQSEGKIKKYYTATCVLSDNNAKKLEGFPAVSVNAKLQNSFRLTSYFRAFGKGRKEVRPVTENASEAALKKVEKKVLYSTEINVLERNDNLYKVEACIVNGYRHQVRCHLAWAGLPVLGDPLYHFESKDSKEMQTKFNFIASKIDIFGDIWYI